VGRQNILHRMMASILRIQYVLNFAEFLFVKVVPKYLNCSTISKELLSFFILWLHPAFWTWDITIYLVLTAFTSRPVSLLVSTKASVSFLCSTYATININRIFLCTLFQNTPSLYSSLNMAENVSHSHKTTAKLWLLKYEGWNFNSGNYLFTTDTK